MQEDLYLTLLYKRLEDALSPAEAEQLEQWLAESPANQALAEDVEAAWNASANLKMEPKVNLDDAFAQLELVMDDESAPEEVAEATSDPKVRDFRSPSPAPSSSTRLWSIAAGIAALVVAGIFLYPRFAGSSETEWLTLASSETIETLTLYDGSEITVYPGATLQYTKEMVEGKRPVKLDGQAFFSIAKDPEHPFTISLPGSEVTVLGTSFGINTDGREHILHVNEGKVSLKVEFEDQARILTANQRCEWNPEARTLEFIPEASPNGLAWHSGTLSFQGTPLREIMEELENQWGVELETRRSEILDCPLTVSFSTRSSIKEVLDKLGLLLGADWENNGGGSYTISGGSC